MDQAIAVHLALIAACQARIAGMEAGNSQYPESQPYTREMFFDVADELERLAESLRSL